MTDSQISWMSTSSCSFHLALSPTHFSVHFGLILVLTTLMKLLWPWLPVTSYLSGCIGSCGMQHLLLWRVGFSLVVSHGLQGVGSAAEAQRMGFSAPRPGIKPSSLAVEGRFLTTGPPGKSRRWLLRGKQIQWTLFRLILLIFSILILLVIFSFGMFSFFGFCGDILAWWFFLCLLL